MTTAEHTPFPVVRRGYDSAQVDEQIDMLSTQLHTAVAARESAIAQVQTLSRKLEAGIGEAQSARATLRGQIAELSTIPLRCCALAAHRRRTQGWPRRTR